MGSSLLARTVFRGAARGSAPLARARLLWAAAQTRDAVMCDLMLRRPGEGWLLSAATPRGRIRTATDPGSRNSGAPPPSGDN